MIVVLEVHIPISILALDYEIYNVHEYSTNGVEVRSTVHRSRVILNMIQVAVSGAVISDYFRPRQPSEARDVVNALRSIFGEPQAVPEMLQNF